jgi:DNA-3-methyladenine glycosylase
VTAPPRQVVGERRPLARADLEVPAPQAAARLLGSLLARREEDGRDTIVRIVETEAYHQDDPASHSHRGRTPRVETMFGPPGHAYVYFVYGMHWAINVSCEPAGVGAAVLLRAAVPVDGADRIRARRGAKHRDRDLLAGPGRLAQALAIDRSLDGTDLCAPDGALRLVRDGYRVPDARITVTPRVGVRHAADVPWRFHLDAAEVSRYVRHPRADER